MKNYLLIISIMSFLFGCRSSKQTICNYENYLVHKNSVFVECQRTNPYNGHDFFGVYYEANNQLYYLIGRRILESESCEKIKAEIEQIVNKTGTVRIESSGIPTPPQPMEVENSSTIPLLKKHNMTANNTAWYSQISNGEKCHCWFEYSDKPCTCLPLSGPDHVQQCDKDR